MPGHSRAAGTTRPLVALVTAGAVLSLGAAQGTASVLPASLQHSQATPQPTVAQVPPQPPLSQTEVSGADLRVMAQREPAGIKVARSVDRTKIWVLPTQHPELTSGYGYRWGRLHAGLDFAMPVGTPLAAMSGGRVVFAGKRGGYGTMLVIRYWDGTMSYYGHLSQLKVAAGDAVLPGQLVALSGNTGHCTGPHLHLEIHPPGTPGEVPTGEQASGTAAAKMKPRLATDQQVGFGDSFNVRAVGPVDPMPWLIQHHLLPASAAKPGAGQSN